MAGTAQRFNLIQIPWSLRQASAPPAKDDAFLGALCRLGAVRGERLTDALMQSLFRGVRFEGKRVLDIGGGDGVYSFYAAARGAAEVVCLEPEAKGWIPGAANIFERIREQLPHLPVKVVPLPVAQYHDGAGFDIVAMICSINHLDEEACTRLLHDPRARQAYRRVFAHIASLTRPGGRLIIADATRHNFFAAIGVKNPLCPTIEWDKHQAPRTWAALLAECGFCKPRITWEPLYRLGPTVQALLANKVAAWFLKSCFRLEMERCAPS